jgi:DNA-binding transcriptional regulator YdaS (Cro superfamily)
MKHRDPILVEVFASYGTAAHLARQLGLSRQCVSQWEKVPLKYIRQIARDTQISPQKLRPDIYAEI